jgi:hypothetical protein
MPAPAALPVALGGDSLSGNSAAIAAVALASMVVGYLVLAALWYFVFRRSPEEREADRRAEAARAEALRHWRPAAASPPADEGETTPAPRGGAHTNPVRIDHRRGPRFRRR